VRGEPLAQDAAHHDQQDEIRRDRAESDVKSAEWRQERNKCVDNMYPLRQDLGHDVYDEECKRAE
jgi:hypothetical protein